MHSDPLLQILILLAASVCVVAGVRKLALPAILGYLAVGMLLGPHALVLAVDNDITRLLAEFGVVFLVFTLGLEFSLPRLVAMRWDVLGVGGAQVLVTASGAGAGVLSALPASNLTNGLTAITTSLGEGVCAVNRSGQMTFVNPAASTMLGWDERNRDARRRAQNAARAVGQ